MIAMDGFLGAAARLTRKHVVASADLAGESRVHALQQGKQWKFALKSQSRRLELTLNGFSIILSSPSSFSRSTWSAFWKKEIKWAWSCISSWGFRDQMRISNEPLVRGVWCNRLLPWLRMKSTRVSFSFVKENNDKWNTIAPREVRFVSSGKVLTMTRIQ